MLKQLTKRNIERELCRRSLAFFVKQAWHVIEPAQPYTHGWVIDAICMHLEAVSDGRIKRLLINVPPGTMKSLLANVFWPAWEWGPGGQPGHRFVNASHEQNLALRDARKMRELVSSDWYQSRWPIELTHDQNQKRYFQNEKTGFRMASAVKSMTGHRGHRVTWDDPLSASGGLSAADRAEAATIFRETLPTRLVDPDTSAIVIIMQRLHEEDPSGLILSEPGRFGFSATNVILRASS